MEKPPAKDLTFRPVKTDAEWQTVIEAQTADGFLSIPLDKYRKHSEDTFANYRAMSEAGLGHWWGAFKGSEMVADLGLFFGRGIGRFQSVETRAAHRWQGVCRSLVRHVSNHAFGAHPDITLMLHADAGEPAERIYKSLGYEQTERLGSAFCPPG